MKLIKEIFLLFTLLAFLSCEDFLEKVPNDEVSESIYYKDTDDAITAINAVYDPLQSNALFGLDYAMIIDVASDNAAHLRGEKDDQEFNDWNITTDNGILTSVWNTSYQGINRANIVLEKVPGIEMDENLQSRILGEAKFLRALYYHILVRMFGDVPLVTEVQEFGDFNVPRTPKPEIYQQIVKDLSEAEIALPSVSEYSDAELGRATKGAAQAYLAKVYLYMEDWEKAANKAKAVIESNEYSLLDEFADNYKEEFENGEESIFEIQFQALTQTGDGSSLSEYILTGMAPNVIRGLSHLLPTDDLVNAFEAGDKRREATLFKEGDDFFGIPYESSWSETGYSPAKYVINGPDYVLQSGGSPLNFHIMRYAEVLLIYAEALNELNRTEEAYEFINKVRNRAGLNSLSGLTQEQFRDALYQERRLELVQEADRFHDLIRTGRAAEVLEPLGFEQGVNEVFPIPFIELERNPLLTQNTGY